MNVLIIVILNSLEKDELDLKVILKVIIKMVLVLSTSQTVKNLLGNSKMILFMDKANFMYINLKIYVTIATTIKK